MHRFINGLLFIVGASLAGSLGGCTVNVDDQADTPRVDVDVNRPKPNVDVDIDVKKTNP